MIYMKSLIKIKIVVLVTEMEHILINPDDNMSLMLLQLSLCPLLVVAPHVTQYDTTFNSESVGHVTFLKMTR